MKFLRQVLAVAVFRIDRTRRVGAATAAVRGRVSNLLSGKRAIADAHAVRATELALVAAIAAVVGANIWLFRPVPAPSSEPPAAPVREQTTAAVGANPFRTAKAPDVAVEATTTDELVDTTLQLTLHGTWIDADGGAAIIGATDNKQSRFAPGDEIVPGAKLERVEREQVVISRNGVREALRLIKRDAVRGASRPATAAASTEASGLAAQGAAIVTEHVLAMPAPDGRGGTWLELRPAGDPIAFNETGLRAGDAVVAVNGQSFGTDIAKGLEALALSDGKFPITLSVERGGVVIPITINSPDDLNGGEPALEPLAQ